MPRCVHAVIDRCARALVALLALALVATGAHAQCVPFASIRLVLAGNAANDNFGSRVAVAGNRVLVGAQGDSDLGTLAGAAYVFRLEGSSFVLEQRLSVPELVTGSLYGQGVALSDDVAAVGAPGHMGTGAVFVFRRNGTLWSFEQKLTPSAGANGDQFGNAISIFEKRLLIGAVNEAGNFTGAAYVFLNDGGTWGQEQRLAAPTPEVFSFYAATVALGDDRALVGARDGNGSINGSGAVFAYRRTGNTWTFEQRISAPDAAASDSFGSAVSLEGDLAAIGARFDDTTASNTGSVYVFRRTGTLWNFEQKLTVPDAAVSDALGSSVSIFGGYIASGAFGDDLPTVADAGSVSLFRRVGNTWTFFSKVSLPDATATDSLGQVAMGPDRLVMGAGNNDAVATNAGGVAVQFLPVATAIVRQPVDTSVVTGQRATLALEATAPPLTTYRWRRAGTPLVDGPALGGGQIIGATSSALAITAAASLDAGAYDCIITSPCGETLTTNPVILTVTPAPLAPCTGDTDGNRTINFLDITTVLTNFGTACP
jgi:hypothetical protein